MDTESLSLPKSAIHAIERPQGWRIECVRGTVWVTHDSHPRDLVLTAGEGHTCVRSSRVLLQALEPVVVRLEAPARRAWPASAWGAAWCVALRRLVPPVVPSRPGAV